LLHWQQQLEETKTRSRTIPCNCHALTSPMAIASQHRKMLAASSAGRKQQD
jgi:hypothetical protein